MSLTAQERATYDKFLKAANPQNPEKITGHEVASFLMKSGLPKE